MFALFLEFGVWTRPQDLSPFLISETGMKFLIVWTQGEIHPGNRAHVKRPLVTRFFEEMSYVFSFTFFSLPFIFHLALVAASVSHFVTAATKFSKKKLPSLFLFFFFRLSFALDLCPPFSRWASLASQQLSLFLCLSLSLYSKFVDMTINLSLIL